MKAICVLGVCVILGLWVLRVAHSASAAPAAAPPPEVGPTDLVASFYKALLQKEEPTLAQETSLFGEKPSFRYKLPAGDRGKATDPVFLRFFRKHREWFLPLGKLSTEQYLSSGVRISTPFRFEGNVQSVFVMAWFVHNATAEDGRDRTVVFSFERGKISVPCIRPGGFDGESVTEKIEMITGVWRKKWLELLKSDDTVGRVHAACVLALNCNEPKALPVLVDSMASFGVPMLWPGHPEAASVGFCAFTSEEKNALEVVVGKGSGDKKLEERISDYLLAPDSLHVQEKNKVASIMMRWFKRNLARFQWDPDSSRLNFIKPVHP